MGEEVERLDGGGIDNSSKLFIKVRAAFYNADTPNIEGLGLDLDTVHEFEDENAVIEDLFISVPQIVSATRNRWGGMNVITTDGDKWSTNVESGDRVRDFLEQISVDLT